jgi:hypothetical protein
MTKHTDFICIEKCVFPKSFVQEKTKSNLFTNEFTGKKVIIDPKMLDQLQPLKGKAVSSEKLKAIIDKELTILEKRTKYCHTCKKKKDICFKSINDNQTCLFCSITCMYNWRDEIH